MAAFRRRPEGLVRARPLRARLLAFGCAAAVAAAVLAGCGPGGGSGGAGTTGGGAAGTTTAGGGTADGRISATPRGGGGGACAPGEHALDLGGRTALLRVAEGDAGGPRPFLLVLHPAGGNARGTLWLFRRAWQEPGAVLLAPESAGATWAPDDVEFVDRALARAFERCTIDGARVGVGGFSDGATYALSLGLADGDLFDAVIAFSPGGVLWEERNGKPRVFVAHGTGDSVLPIGRTSDEIVPRLREAGYDVTYRRFDGGHRVPRPLAADAVEWFLGS